MKKLLAVCLCALLFAGCSAQSERAGRAFVGSWQATRGEMGGTSVALDDIESTFSLELDKDGGAVFATQRTQTEGSWEALADDKGVRLTLGDETLELSKIRDDALKGPIQGVTLTFEKAENK